MSVVNIHLLPARLKRNTRNIHFWAKRFQLSLSNLMNPEDINLKFSSDRIAFLEGLPHENSVVKPIFEEMTKQGFNPIWVKENVASSDRWLYVTGRALIPRAIRRHVVWVSHGVGDEWPEPWHIECIRCLLPGSYWYNRFIEKCPAEKLKIIGYPKLDVLFSPRVNTIKKEYDLLLPYEKTILYSPTSTLYCPMNPSFENAIFVILKMCKQLKINLIIKAHPNIHRCVRPSIVSKAKAISDKMPNVLWIDPRQDIVPYYLLSDVLISDMSSTLREFMLTGKPSIQLIDFIPEKYLFQGVILSSIRDLYRNVPQAISHPDMYYHDRQKAIKSLFFKSDGHASERAVMEIKKLLM